MPETAFLDALLAYLAGLTGAAALLPSPALLGISEPTATADLPALVLSLDQAHRLGAGLGERALLVSGSALPWSASIDLAHPVLPDEPGFSLLSADRRSLTLPHGGLKRTDGSDGLLGPADLSVRIGATVFAVVAGAPVGNQMRADAAVGQLLFGNPLPAAGTLQVSYVLGQWERRVTPIAGTLRLDIYAADAPAAVALSKAVLQALSGISAAQIRGLRKLSLAQIGPVLASDAARASARRRSALLGFEYEHEINRPDPSGGLIARVDIATVVDADTDKPTQVP
jgi:hypothetical protein